jgi:hypothetical protein
VSAYDLVTGKLSLVTAVSTTATLMGANLAIMTMVQKSDALDLSIVLSDDIAYVVRPVAQSWWAVSGPVGSAWWLSYLSAMTRRRRYPCRSTLRNTEVAIMTEPTLPAVWRQQRDLSQSACSSIDMLTQLVYYIDCGVKSKALVRLWRDKRWPTHLLFDYPAAVEKIQLGGELQQRIAELQKLSTRQHAETYLEQIA